MISAVCFDLFETLIEPHVELLATESAPLGISAKEWEAVHWEEKISNDRGLGRIKTEEELIDRLCALLPFTPTKEQKNAVLQAKRERMKKCLVEVPAEILKTIRELKKRGFKIGLVSNADVCDIAAWAESPLSPFFDDAIFSCDVGLLKPDRKIYEMSLHHLGVKAENALFVGDGGSDELFGAKNAGLKTVLTECLLVREKQRRETILKSADFRISHFSQLLDIVQSA